MLTACAPRLHSCTAAPRQLNSRPAPTLRRRCSPRDDADRASVVAGDRALFLAEASEQLVKHKAVAFAVYDALSSRSRIRRSPIDRSTQAL